MTHFGLSNDAAQERLLQFGPNALPERPPTPLWRRFARQVQSPLIYILLFALVADAAIWVSEGATGAPDMDGPATIRALRRLDQKVKIIATCGLKAEDKISDAAQHGVKTFLPKPYTAEKLLKTVAAVLKEE